MTYTGKQYTGKGQGVYNTVAASIGAANALGGDNCGGGLFGGLFGGNRHNCYVTEKENNLSTALAIAQSEKYATEQTNKSLEALYAQTIRSDDQIKAVNASIADGLIQTGNALGVLTAQVECLKNDVTRNREESFRNLNEAKDYTNTRVDAEAQLRKCEDEKVVLWVKAQNYVPAVLRVDPDQICGASPISSGCCYD